VSTVSGLTKPSALPPRFDRIPTDLTVHHRWMTWNWEEKPEKSGQWTKPPYNCRTGGPASSTNPDTWSTFEEAMLGYETGRWDGIGLALACEGHPFHVRGLDLDDVIDPSDGTIHPEALRIVRQVNSYTERSPSGLGLRIVTRGGPLPDGWRNTKRFTFPIEMYDSGRYLTITGHHLEGTPETIEERTTEVTALHARIAALIDSGNGHHAGASPTAGDSIPDDEVLLERARGAQNGAKFSQLWAGDTSAYDGDDSAADLALCSMLAFWTGRDAARMDRLFRRSALMRPKWDERRGEQTYGARTIAAAIRTCHEVYTPPRATEAEAPPNAAESHGDAWPLYDGAEDWDFPAIAELIDSLLPATGIVWWGGLPKRYKSLFALYCALALACRRSSVAKKFLVRAFPKILYVSREDGGGRLKDRRDDILSAWTERPEPGAIIFVIRPRLDLLNPEHVTWVRETCTRLGITMLVLDTWTALSPSADPLGAKDQAQLSAVVVRLCEDIGGLVVVVDHSRKNRPDGQPLSSADIFGPPQKWAAAEHIVMLDVIEAGRRLEVFIEGKDMDTRRFFLAISPRGSGEEKFTFAGSVEEVAQAQREKGDQNREAVYRALCAAGVHQSLAQVHAAVLARGLTLSKATISNHLRALVDVGRASMNGEGKATRYLGITNHDAAPSSANGRHASDLFDGSRS
jgi:putative DNA primase/helicase